ncbi:MAG: hypothetical protein ABJQ90_16290 [Parasphingorhabdus sp.]
MADSAVARDECKSSESAPMSMKRRLPDDPTYALVDALNAKSITDAVSNSETGGGLFALVWDIVESPCPEQLRE